MVRRQTNLLWGVVVLALAVALFAYALGSIPAGVFDLILRAWPALLLLGGLSILLRGRVPFSGAIALVISAVVAGLIVSSAYSTRASQVRADNHQPINQPIGALTLLRVRVQTLATDVDLLSTLTTDITGEFVGSSSNRIDVSYEESADSSATLTLREIREGGDFPSLDTVGRGTLHLELPPNVPVDVEFLGQDGSIVLNMGGTALERLNVTSQRGDVIVTLPEYRPLLSAPTDSLGTINVNNGNLAMFIPSAVGARLELQRGSSPDPQYDPNIYNFLVGDILEARNIGSAPITMNYTLRVPNGRIRIEVPS